MGETAFPVGAEHAEAVGVVQHQPGVETLGQGEQLGQGRQIPVHAEHRVADDDLGAGVAGGQQALQGGHVVVGVAVVPGSGKLHRVDERGVIEPVGEDGVVPARGQGGGDGQVGQVAGGEGEHSGKAGEGGQALLQDVVGPQVAAHQVRGA